MLAAEPDTYSPALDGARSYDAAVEALRRQYEAARAERPGLTPEQFMREREQAR